MVIDFTNARPNEIRIEDFSEWEQSTFLPVYRKAEKCLKEIVSSDNARKDAPNILSRQVMLSGGHNRIMAFVGDRGMGKTSAMVSFVSACVDGKIERFKQYSFYAIPVIEPSKLSEGENIVGSIVSQIYSEFEDKLSLDGTELNRAQIRKISKPCMDVREALRVQGMSMHDLLQQNVDELSQLRLLAQTKRLQDRLHELIDNYLKLKENPSHGAERRLLIIPIDDIDTSIPNAYRLIEELRNYLMLPNVVVMMALKLEQLSDALEQRFIHEFQDLWREGSLMDAQPAEMAAKYIQKLIPAQRQIEMPDMDILTLSNCFIKSEPVDEPLVDYFLALIYKKTGILLVKDAQGGHPLIPRNLRVLHQSVEVFRKMKNICDLKGPEGQSDCLDQIQELEAWLLNAVSGSALNSALRIILQRFAAHPNQDISPFLWRSLSRYFSLRDIAPEVTAVLDRSVRNENISMGDVLHLLMLLQRTDAEDDFAFFSAAIRLLYSIRIRRNIIGSLTPGEHEPLTDAQPRMPEESYLQILWILNGLVYDPQERVTYDGFERMYNGDASAGMVADKRAGTQPFSIYSLGGGTVLHRETDSDETNRDYMLPREAVWISQFIVGYGRVIHGDIHSMEASTLNSILRSDSMTRGEPVFVSANWMAFLHNMLCPEYAMNRLLWKVSDLSPEAKSSFDAVIEGLRDARFSLLFGCLHIDSVDFLDAIVRYMVVHTGMIFQETHDDLAVLNGYFHFRLGLRRAVETVLKRANIKVDLDPLENFLDFAGLGSSGDQYVMYNWLGGNWSKNA